MIHIRYMDRRITVFLIYASISTASSSSDSGLFMIWMLNGMMMQAADDAKPRHRRYAKCSSK